MADVDLTDPCVRAQYLTAAYYRLITGEQESQVQYLANGVQRTVMYSKADMKELIGEIRSAEAECQAKQGLPVRRRRFAIQGGSRSTY